MQSLAKEDGSRSRDSVLYWKMKMLVYYDVVVINHVCRFNIQFDQVVSWVY